MPLLLYLLLVLILLIAGIRALMGRELALTLFPELSWSPGPTDRCAVCDGFAGTRRLACSGSDPGRSLVEQGLGNGLSLSIRVAVNLNACLSQRRKAGLTDAMLRAGWQRLSEQAESL